MLHLRVCWVNRGGQRVARNCKLARRNRTLREKVFCVLGTLGYVHTPIHTHTFTPRHLSAMTVSLRKYDPTTGTFKPVATTTSKVGLWFKIQTEDC